MALAVAAPRRKTVREEETAGEMGWEIGRERWELHRRRWRWSDKDCSLGDKASEAAVFRVWKGRGKEGGGQGFCRDAAGGKRIDGQTGRKPEVFHVGVGTVLWTQLSDSAFRAGRPQREEDRETGSRGSTIKALSGREEERGKKKHR